MASRLAALLAIFAFFAAAASPVEVTFMEGYDPDRPETAVSRAILALAKSEPELSPSKWGGLTLPGAGGRAPFMLSLAGGSAPDLYKCWFHIMRHDIEQGFAYPLNEWIGEDLDGDGKISDAEAKWPGWKNVPQLWRDVATKDGKVYGVPQAGVWHYGIVYRKDLVRQAGLDPEAPPETWEEFFAWCQRLTFPRKKVGGAKVQRGQRAFGAENRPWGWLPWVQSAGGELVVEQDGALRANFDSPEAIAAAGFFRKLIWSPWVRIGDTIIDLTDEEIAAGKAVRDGREYVFAKDEVVKGVVRALPRITNDLPQLFAQGEVVALFAGAELMESLTQDSNITPDMLGLMPFPAADKTLKPVLQVHKHFYAMTEGVGRRPKSERDLVWKCLESMASQSVNDADIKEKVLEGNARWCSPDDLRRLGLEDYLEEVPSSIRTMYDRLAKGEIRACTEPWAGFWQAVSDIVDRRLLGILLSDAGEHYDYETALHGINAAANGGLMFQLPESELAARRPLARTLFGIVTIVLLACIAVTWKRRAPELSGDAAKAFRLSPWLFLAPAVLSIALWSYYPLVRGAVMAFQDYKIVGDSSFAGLDNFILVARDATFWKAWIRTGEYVAVTMLLGFLAPIILAVLLSEIPRGKIFFRTMYFLPHLTSALVIALLWKMMYDPTENGMLNQILALFGLPRQSWLQDPSLAMVCCILPGVWAGAGMSSLIYIAALHSLPADYYEAAAIDGAGILSRFRHITFPQLLPLMVINFVGAFIAACQGMGGIFLLTFGGPGDATNVLSLAIWKEAYNNLRFSAATTMAWFLGAALVGFTYLQIRMLRKVEFRQAKTN